MALRVSLPGNNWQPRDDQMPFWQYLERGGTRMDICAHRRWGKDDLSLHWTAVSAHKKVGTYWHMLPEAAQARKAIWDAVNPRTGLRRIDEAFPKDLRSSTRDQDMFIRFKNNSSWQVIGSDNYNSLVGSPPVGVVFSEWSLANPTAWTYLRPILAENGGWAAFLWTPRGRNHATRAFDSRAKDPYWFAQKVPAAIRIAGESDAFPKDYEEFQRCFRICTPVFTMQALYQELKEMVEESGSQAEGLAKFGQEYLVDFDAPVPGSYFGEQMLAAANQGRIGYFPYDPAFPVSTAWDLGFDDYTAIWFLQRIRIDRVHAIAYYETNGQGFDDGVGGGIVPEAFGDRGGWNFNMHYLPHDVQVHELGAGGRSRRETLNGLGIRPLRVGVARDPAERINASRKLIPYTYFDKENAGPGVDRLKQYRKKWNPVTAQFAGPMKDGNDHGADAYGEFAVNARLPTPKKSDPPTSPNDRYVPRIIKATRSMFGAKVPHWKVA